MSYGDKSNTDMLMYYGFTIENNDFNQVNHLLLFEFIVDKRIFHLDATENSNEYIWSWCDKL